MAKTESTAITSLINAVQSQPISSGLPAPQPGRPMGTPTPEMLAQAAQIQQQARRNSAAIPAQPAPSLPPPRPSQQMAAAQPWQQQPQQPQQPMPQAYSPYGHAPQMSYPPGMSAPPRGGMDDSWFDQQPDAASEPTDAVEFDFGESEGVRRRSRWPLWAATAAAVGAGAALGWYLAFGMPGKNNPTTAAQPAAAPAAEPAATAAPIAAPAGEPAPAAEAEPAAAVEPVAVPEPVAEAAPTEPAAEPLAAPAAEPALPVMTRAHFESDPPGATVTLIDEGRPLLLGPTPVDQSLDPSHSYQAVFTIKGQPAVMIPVAASGARMTVRAKMGGKNAGAAVTSSEPAAEPAAAPVRAPAAAPRASARKEPTRTVARREPKQDKPKATATGGRGTLMLNSKPPCEVIVDGRKVGSTPKPNISLSSGKHKVTLVNSTYGIKTSFSVSIKAGEKTRVIKDLSDRIR